MAALIHQRSVASAFARLAQRRKRNAAFGVRVHTIEETGIDALRQRMRDPFFSAPFVGCVVTERQRGISECLQLFLLGSGYAELRKNKATLWNEEGCLSCS